MKKTWRMPLLLILLLAYAVPTQLAQGMNANAIDSMTIIRTHEGSISTGSDIFRDLELNISVSLSDSQQVSTIDGAIPRTTPYGRYVYITESSPPNPYKYSIRDTIRTVATSAQATPQTQLSDSDIAIYTSSTPQVETQFFRQLAQNITAYSNSDFERLGRLLIWVNNRTTYDISLAGREESAKWVYENMRGVCVEYTNLFMALSRSLGIPTRYVTGITYSNMLDGWLGHAWAQAHIGGKWVSADPTWLELGSLDATHVRYFEGIETKTLKDISFSAYVQPGEQLYWNSTGGDLGTLVQGIQVVSSHERLPESGYTLVSTATELNGNEQALITFSYVPKEYGIDKLTLVPCANPDSQSLLTLDSEDRYVIMEPNVPVVANWVATASGSLQSGYYYQCPLVLNSNFFGERQLEITIYPKIGGRTAIMTSESPSALIEILNGTDYTMTTKLLGGADEFTLATNDYYYKGQGDQLVSRTIRFNRTGFGNFYLATEDGAVRVIPYLVVPGNQTTSPTSQNSSPNQNVTNPLPNYTDNLPPIPNVTQNDSVPAGQDNETGNAPPPTDTTPRTSQSACLALVAMFGAISLYVFSTPGKFGRKKVGKS